MNDTLNQRMLSFFDKRRKHKNRICKIIFAGNGAVGKTSLMRVLKEKQNLVNFEKKDLDYYRTPFMEIETIQVKEIDPNSEFGDCKIMFCDLAGQKDLPIHALSDLSDFVLSKADFVVLFFASDNAQSFLDLADWIQIIKDYYEARELQVPAFLLLENKSDQPSAMDDNFINMLIQSEPNIINHISISCLHGTNIDKLKSFIVKFFN